MTGTRGRRCSTRRASRCSTAARRRELVHRQRGVSFTEWYTNVPGVNHSTATTLTLCRNAAGNYVNRWGPNSCDAWPVTKTAYFCGNVDDEVLDAIGNPIPCTFAHGTTDCDMVMAMDLTAVRISCTVANGSYRRCSDRHARRDADLLSRSTATPSRRPPSAAPPPSARPTSGRRLPAGDAGAPLHNFSFTSEVRYWFPFDSSKTYTLKFLGDDDVWVFINARLAVDLGGIHTAVGCNSLVATCAIGQVTVSAASNFGMTNGNVYEVVVFQAERQKTSSSYQLTLSAFNGAPTACGPTCGDRVVTPPEQCDNGTADEHRAATTSARPTASSARIVAT